MPRVLLLATTTGYQTRAFGVAAERLGIDLVLATDRCHVLEDPWRDAAIPVRFYDEAGSVAAIVESSAKTPIDGIVVVGDRPTVIAASAMEALGLPGHSSPSAAAARNKRATREKLRAAGLPVPRFAEGAPSGDPRALISAVGFPAVVKPLALSGSRGVMRVNDESELVAALYRLRSLLASRDIRAERDDAHDLVLLEQFVEGREFAVEGLMNHGTLDVLAIFDKPDPLDGPFFEETIYVTPSAAPAAARAAIADAVSSAVRALGLYHGPIHAECRVNPRGVYVLEVAARPIGGLCARALCFVRREGSLSGERQANDDSRAGVRDPSPISFEELLLRHSLGERSTGWRRERPASGVMMIPIPRRGIFRGVTGVDEARAVGAIGDVRITAKLDQMLVPLPEGASYLGFIFARADRAADVESALRAAHQQLSFTIVPEVRMLQSVHG
jgi:formate-dependent phosphoribosylglycinamide formyltransferase (GAR transformylase)